MVVGREGGKREVWSTHVFFNKHSYCKNIPTLTNLQFFDEMNDVKRQGWLRQSEDLVQSFFARNWVEIF